MINELLEKQEPTKNNEQIMELLCENNPKHTKVVRLNTYQIICDDCGCDLKLQDVNKSTKNEVNNENETI